MFDSIVQLEIRRHGCECRLQSRILKASAKGIQENAGRNDFSVLEQILGSGESGLDDGA